MPRLKSPVDKYELAGAFSWAVLEGGLEAKYNNSGGFGLPYDFPYIRIPYTNPLGFLPPGDDAIIPATALIPMAVGNKMRKPKVEDFGRGAAIYGIGDFFTAMVWRALYKANNFPTLPYTPNIQFSGSRGKYVVRG